MLAVRFRGALFVRGSRFWTEGLKKFGSGQGIDDVIFFQPASARHGDPVVDEREVAGVVGIGRNDHLDAAFLAHAERAVLVAD